MRYDIIIIVQSNECIHQLIVVKTVNFVTLSLFVSRQYITVRADTLTAKPRKTTTACLSSDVPVMSLASLTFPLTFHRS
jgi:hypothetical protein